MCYLQQDGQTKADLLFYHRLLQCMVAIELKTTEFRPAYKGQKLWLAQVGSQRIDQMQDPELSFQQGVEDYQNIS